MIGKNVGIKRASGRYILATNIDIIFSDKTFFYIKNKLDESHVYTAIRHDIPSQLPLNMNKIKWASKNFFRVHHTLGSIQIKKSSHLFYNLFGFFYAAYVIYLKKMLEELTRNFTFASANPAQQKWGGDISNKIRKLLQEGLTRTFTFASANPAQQKWGGDISNKIRKLLQGLTRTFTFASENPTQRRWSDDIYNQIRKIKGCFIKVNSILVLASEHLQVVYKKPHTNACGDFTLCSKKIWDVLRGYPEWDTMSWHLDSIYIYQAKNSGFPIKKVGGKIFHIEHSPGSGYTPEHAELLFDRLRQKGITFLSNEEFQNYIDQQEKTSAPIIYNPKNWGLSDLNLTETVISKIDL
jgi:hypothetical protein